MSTLSQQGHPPRQPITVEERAKSWMEEVKEDGPLSKVEKQRLEYALSNRDFLNARLTDEEARLIARLTLRQTKRLNKNKLMAEDRKLIKALERLKETKQA